MGEVQCAISVGCTRSAIAVTAIIAVHFPNLQSCGTLEASDLPPVKSRTAKAGALLGLRELRELLTGRAGLILSAAGLVTLLAFQQFASIGGSDLLGRTLNNSLHIPLFALIALFVARMLRRPNPLLVLLICVALAGLSELAQVFTSRDASLSDFGLDLVGTVPVVIGLTLSRHGAGCASNAPNPWLLWGAIAVLIVVLTAAAPARVLAAYISRDQAFPVLFDPAEWRQRPLWSSNSATRIVRGKNFPGFESARALEVTWAATRYPGITLTEVVPDWSGYEVLIVEVWVPADQSMPLTVALGYDGRPGTAAYLPVTAEPGYQRLKYPLDKLLSGEGGAPRIDRVILHTAQRFAGRRVLVGQLRLQQWAPEGAPDWLRCVGFVPSLCPVSRSSTGPAFPVPARWRWTRCRCRSRRQNCSRKW